MAEREINGSSSCAVTLPRRMAGLARRLAALQPGERYQIILSVHGDRTYDWSVVPLGRIESGPVERIFEPAD